MFASSPLDRMFGNGPAKVLDALLRSDGLTVRQVSRVAGIAPGTASAALRRLERQWVVVSKPVGSALQYWVNEAHFAVRPLRDLVESAERLEAGLPHLIVSILGSTPRSIILFGSAARKEADRDSDVDLLVVAHSEQELGSWRNRVDDLGEALARRIGGPLDVLMVAPPTKADLRRPFWRNVLRDGRVISGEPLTGP